MYRFLLPTAILFGLLSTPLAAADMEALKGEGKRVIQQFGGALKKELENAMKSGGPQKAIPVCNVEAPEIAAKVSGREGWSVARSSHRLRNPKNAPDDFTRNAIEEFLAREAKGETADKLVKAAIVEEDGKTVFRIVKAIPTADLCLSCHGSDEVKPEVEGLLSKYYPEDQARGFRIGQMRGVFTLSKAVE